MIADHDLMPPPEDTPYRTDSREGWRAPTQVASRRDGRFLRRDLLGALARNEFEMRFQPRHCMTSHCITTLESSIRLRAGRRGGISEATLIELACQARVLNSLYSWAIASGARALIALAQPIHLSIKAPAAVIGSSILFHCLDHAVTELGIMAEQLEISISETVLAALDDSSLLTLAGLFDEGVSIAISHFGGELASLRLLTRIPVDRVLIDARLIRALPDDPGSMAIARGAVETAHALGARVVASGVETKAQRGALKRIGCDEAQGGLFSPPLTLDKVMVRARKLSPAQGNRHADVAI